LSFPADLKVRPESEAPAEFYWIPELSLRERREWQQTEEAAGRRQGMIRNHSHASILLGAFAVAFGLAGTARGDDNFSAANGPLPGEIALIFKEEACAQALKTPGYFQSINAAELADAQRSGTYPCATFTGAFNGDSQVFAWRSHDSYPAVSFINNRKPGELYLTGGDLPKISGPVAPGPFIAKADATTGREIWRTYLDNANVSGHWIAVSNLNILSSGNIVFAWANRVAVLDGDSGRPLAVQTLPTGSAPIDNTNFKHVTIAPDGTIILKDQTLPIGETGQGSFAMIKGIQDGFKQPNSMLVAVDPRTLQIFDSVEMPEPSSVPHGITTFEGKIAIYAVAREHAYRYFWDPAAKKLTQDPSWVVSYLDPGQTNGAAPAIMGDWVVIQTNGAPPSRTKASSLVAINQKAPSRVTKVFPFGQLEPGQQSFAPPKSGSDAENDMVYSQDLGFGKVAGVKLDQATGELKTVFVVDDRTTCLVALVGPKDKRVMLTSNQRHDFPFEPMMLALGTGFYREQVRWRDAATGRLIAESDLMEPMSVNTAVTPGFGGRVYYPTDSGFVVLQLVGRR
jgi:hypothetical protein